MLACGSDVRCTADRLRSLTADRALIVLVNELVQPKLLDLRWLDLTTGTAIDTNVRPMEPGAPLIAQIRSRAGQLLARSHPKLGRLRVRTEPPDASITIEPTPDETLSDRIVQLPPGSYTVTASFPDRTPQRTVVDVQPGGDHEVTLRLASPPSILSSPWFWGGAAAVVAGAVTTGILLSSRDACFCLRRDGAGCNSCSVE